MRSFYDILGVNKESSPEEIKSAFLKLARTVRHCRVGKRQPTTNSQCHPDKGGNADEFRAIQTAYDTLRDSEKRLKYDTNGKECLLNVRR